MKKTLMPVMLAVLLGSAGQAFAHSSAMQNIDADYRSWNMPHATAALKGTDEKTLLQTATPSDYTVCAGEGDEVSVAADGKTYDLAGGDCMMVNAAQISAKGKDENSFNRAFLYSHTHYTKDRPGHNQR